MMQTRRELGIYFLLLLFLQPMVMAQDGSQDQQHGRKLLVLAQREGTLVLDGNLDEEAWSHALEVGDFKQKDPDEGMPATEETKVRALFDGENLYFGVRCLDSQPGSIVATELRRDDTFGNDAGLDVTYEEPCPKENPLWDFPNVILTSHSAGQSQRYRQRAIQLFMDNLHRFVKGEPLANVVDKEKGY